MDYKPPPSSRHYKSVPKGLPGGAKGNSGKTALKETIFGPNGSFQLLPNVELVSGQGNCENGCRTALVLPR